MNEQNNIIRYMESLAVLMQESAEIGQMDSAVYADVAELMAQLAGLLKERRAAA